MRTARISGKFKDIDELGQLAGWDVGFRQLDSGAQSIPARLVTDGHLTVIRMDLNCRFHQLGTPPTGLLSFGVPVAGMRDWFGNAYSDGSILPFNQPGGIDGVSESGFSAFTVSLDKSLLTEVSQSFGIPVPNYFLESDPDMVIAHSPETRRFRAAIGHVVHSHEQPLDRRTVDELVVSLLRAGLSDNVILDKSTPASRSRALSRALAFIAENTQDDITVRELCAASVTPLRTLDRAFKERFDIGPKAYLQRTRLSKVRATLLMRVPGTRIADVANASGFWHMGQFARDYKRMFGELPSETLRDGRRPGRFLEFR